MAVSPLFTKYYKSLNPQQKRAVDSIEGPVMVIAGPGTGKTQILTLRIANILRKTDTAPENILALTFTESGVASMRRRLTEITGSVGYRVPIFTFHGFCNHIITRYPDEFPKIIGASHINDVDKIALLKEIIGSEPLVRLRPFGDNFFYVSPLRGKISELKRENISPQDLHERLMLQRQTFESLPDLYHESGAHEGKMRGKYADLLKQLEKNEEFCRVYNRYEELLLSRRLYDYDDMIVETVRMLQKSPELLLMLQEEYQYVLADEHQDANAAQNRLLELLSGYHESPNLFIVGDEKQAIFRFQGASLENFLYFKRLYPGAQVITLVENYRSRQHVLDAAHSVISNSTTGDPSLRVALKSAQTGKQQDTARIELRRFTRADHEYLFVARDIEQKLVDGVEPHQIAVLYRNNRDAQPLVRVLERTAVPFSVESDQNVLSDPDMRKLLLLLEATHRFGEDSALVPVLHLDFLELDVLDIYKLFAYGKNHKLSLYTILKSLDLLIDAGLGEPKKFLKLYELIARFKVAGENIPLPEFFTQFIEESGFLTYMLLEPQAADKLARLSGFNAEVQSLAQLHRDYRLSDLIAYLALLREHNILIKKDFTPVLRRTVRLMTAHRSKGLEFDYVYIIGAVDGKWGNQRDIEHFHLPVISAELPPEDVQLTKLDDERRLFYVALTRARHGVYVSYSKEGRGMQEQLPSQFLGEIDAHLLLVVDVQAFESSVRPDALLRPRGNQGNGLNIQDKAFLNELFVHQGLSVTALNNYLESPWTYFYSNLLRVPQAPDKHMIYGTAVHQALCSFFNILSSLGEGRDIGKEALVTLFEDALKRQPISGHEYEEALKKGRTALRGYYDAYKNKWNTDVLNEYRLTVALPVDVPGMTHLRLRGDLDKIEFIGAGSAVNIVDYKTGRPQSRNAIEGKTKSATGGYKRQLVFYKLLLDLHENKKFQMVSGEIDFVEPDLKGKFKKERFSITEEEVEELKQELKRVAREILDLSFWNTSCDPQKSDFCELQAMLKENMAGVPR